MLRFLQSIFGQVEKGNYPESLVSAAVERAVDATDPQIRAVSRYKKRLRPAVLRAIDHVVALVERLSPPVPVTLENWGVDPTIRSFFVSLLQMRKLFLEDRSLAEFLKKSEGGASEIVLLLAMEKQEKVMFGAALSGDIVVRDVPQVAVNFDGHRLMDPAGSEGEIRALLKRRAYDHLLSLALRRLTALKWERNDLERRRTLLEAKLNLFQREGWGFDRAEGGERFDQPQVERRLAEIEEQMEKLGGDDRVLENYLEVVAGVLGHPEEYLRGRRETIFLDRMGIKQSEAGPDSAELRLSELYNAEGRSLVVTLVSLRREELLGASP